MIKFLKGLFQSTDASPAKEEAAVEYNGFNISPCPRKVPGGWSTEAIIRKTINGEPKTHNFIRADSSTTFEAAISLITGKARMLIDQRGDKIFDSSQSHK